MKRKLLAVVLAAAVGASFLAGIYLSKTLRSERGAVFRVENLKISPRSPYEKIYSRTPVTISVDVSNVGTLSGVKHVSIEVDNEVIAEDALPLVVEESRTFETKVKTGDEAHGMGTHTVEVGGLTGITGIFDVEKLPVEVSVGDFVHPTGALCQCARGQSARPNSPLLEVSVTNGGNENMAPFRVVLGTPGGTFIEGGVIAQTESACPSACARGNLQGKTTYYVPINNSVMSPKTGKYELKVADYNLQGVREKQISYSGPSPQVVQWGPIQFEGGENGYISTRGKVTVANKGDLPLSVAGLSVSVGGENLNGTVKGEPFVLPGEEKTLQLEFENPNSIQGGSRTAKFKLLKWVEMEGSRTVTAIATTTKEIEVKEND